MASAVGNNNHLSYCSILENETPAIAFKSTIDFNTQAAVMPESDNEDQHMQDTASVTQAESVDDNSSKEQRTHPLLATSKVMGIMLGGFDRMGEGDSKKMQKLVLNRAKTNQTTYQLLLIRAIKY